MRRVGGETSGVNSALETISAAATAIASAEARGPPASVPKRKWGGCWSIYWCFGYQKHSKRIGHAVLGPETTSPRTEVPEAESSNQAPAVVLPFVAPPSSPASFLQSEPTSAMQSPAGLISFTSVSANIYSPGERPSIFAIGPYAHETQLVSPPVFSTFTTEPSTAPFTPPPESVHLTTPSSPEVPFAQLLNPSLRNGDSVQRIPLSQYEFQPYQLYPGSPVGHLISPSSGISGSGTSSPFPDREFGPVGAHHFLEFRTGEPPKLLNLDKLAVHEWGSRRGSGSMTPDAVRLSRHECGSQRASGSVTPDSTGPTPRGNYFMDCQTPEVAQLANSQNGCRSNEMAIDHRVSFELTAEDVVRCVERKEPTALFRALSTSLENEGAATSEDERLRKLGDGCEEHRVGETINDVPGKAPAADVEGEHRYQKHRSITLGSVKEFNFDNVDGQSEKSDIGSDWWANEHVEAKEGVANKNWSFFPMLQPGVS